MQHTPTVGLAIIAKNEESNLPRLLASVEGAFDRVVLLDTGSKDRTVQVFQAWAKNQPITFGVGHFDWCQDFAAARNAADRLLLYGTMDDADGRAPMLDWTCWADCDDEIAGAGRLRVLAANVRPEIDALIFDYDYAHHPGTGEVICRLRRERLVRAGRGQWVGRVHEAQIVNGPTAHVPRSEGVVWVHRKLAGEDHHAAAEASNRRNIEILTAWDEDEPDNPRVVAYLGNEHAACGEVDTAIAYFERYLTLKTTWDDERAQVHRKLAMAYVMKDRLDDAEATALEAVALAPWWPDSYLTLAEINLGRGAVDKTIFHAEAVLKMGPPDTLLIINPVDYVGQPHRLLAGAYGVKGMWEKAFEHAQIAVRYDNADPQIVGAYHHFRKELERANTARTYVTAAQHLIACDEQAKALTLLEECVPVFATDHPEVVALRSHLRERLAWTRTPQAFADHYETGGSKPEDFIKDEDVPRIAGSLPRVRFLLAGLEEQAA